MRESILTTEYIGFESFVQNLSDPVIRKNNECLAVVNSVWKLFRFSVLGNHKHAILNPFDVILLRLSDSDTYNADELRLMLLETIVSEKKEST